MKRSPGGHGRTGRTVWLVMCAAVAMIAAMMTFPGVARAAVPGSYAVYSGKWGTSGTGNGQFDTPHGVAVSKQGYVYVADTYNDRIQKFTTGGAYQTQWGSYGTGNGQFNEPDSVAVDTTGNVYVTDWGNNRVQKFSPDGVFLFKITSWVSGSADNHFNHPTGIAVDAANNVYVSNTDMGSVEKFDSAGTFLTNWNYGGILTAAGIAIHPSGWVFSAASADLASNVDNRVYQCGLDGSGETIWWLSDDSSPWGVGINPSGGIFVTDVTWDRIQQFTPHMELVRTWGTSGSGNGQFSGPSAIAFDSAGAAYVADTDNDRIQKFSFVSGPTIIELAGPPGSDRYATSIATSRATFATGTCNSVVLATGRNFPDALAAAGLAGVANCPILLVDGTATTANAATKAEIIRLAKGRPFCTIYIAGSAGVVSDGIKNSLTTAKLAPLKNVTTMRLAGADRYATANEIAKRVGVLDGLASTKAIVVTGSDYHDALLAGPVAYKAKIPVLLVGTSVPTALKTTMTTVGVKKVEIIGSTTRVSDTVKAQLGTALGTSNVTRPCSIADPYAQGVDVADWAWSSYGFNWSGVGIATGENYPDALGAAPVQGKAGNPLLFAPATMANASANTTVRAALAANKSEISLLRYFGSTGAVSQGVRNGLEAALK